MLKRLAIAVAILLGKDANVAFLVGLALLPLAEETKGKELPA